MRFALSSISKNPRSIIKKIPVCWVRLPTSNSMQNSDIQWSNEAICHFKLQSTKNRKPLPDCNFHYYPNSVIVSFSESKKFIKKSKTCKLRCSVSSRSAAFAVIIPLSGDRGGRRVKAASAGKRHSEGHNYRRPLMKAITLLTALALTLRGRRVNVAPLPGFNRWWFAQ